MGCFPQGETERVMPRDLHLSTLELNFSPTVSVHGAAELVAGEGFKGFRKILFPFTNPHPGRSTFQEQQKVHQVLTLLNKLK